MVPERLSIDGNQLAEVETEIDEEVYRLYEISPEDRRAIEDDSLRPACAEEELEEEEDKDEEVGTEAGRPCRDL